MKDFLFWRMEKINSWFEKFPLRKSTKLTSSLFVSLIALLALLNLTLARNTIEKRIDKEKLLPKPIGFSSRSPYPVLARVLGESTFTFAGNNLIQEPVLSARAALVMDNDSKVIVFAKNENLRFSMASTTKLMTALTALEVFKLHDILTIQKDNIEGSIIGFRKGEKLYFEDLLYAMLLPSGNDAALAVADNYQGGESAFVEKMNENAKKLYLLNTSFGDPAGLRDDQNYTTAVDLARLGSLAMENSTIARIVGTKQRTIATTDGKRMYKLQNLNKLLGSGGINGIKTGSSDEAGEVLVTSDREGTHTFITVILKSDDRFEDTQNLLTNVVKRISYITFSP